MKKVRLFAWGVFLTGTFSSAAMAQFPILSAEQVNEWMNGKQKIGIIDARSPQEYEAAHIPGAINIPAERMKPDADRLPKDKATPMIFYCRGYG